MTLKVRWVGDNVYGHTGYSNNVRELMYELNKICDAKVIQKKQEGYIPPKAADIVIEEPDVDEETHLSGRTFVYREALAPYRDIARTLSAIMVLEGDRIPQDWLAVANSLDFLWTASTYGFTQFCNNRVIPEKIRVIPHGVDTSIFHPIPHVVNNKPDGFCFGYVGGFAIPEDRKGADIVAKAFSEEFSPKEKVYLLMKINSTYNPSWDSAGYLRQVSNNHPKLLIDTQDYNQEQLANFYNLTDIHVQASKGEAFSMNLAESMACAKPVLVTNWSGYLDYTLPEFSYLFDYDGFEVASYGGYDIMAGTKWARPSLASLRTWMRYVYNNQDEVRKKGIKAQQYIMDNYKWSDAAKKMVKVLKNV